METRQAYLITYKLSKSARKQYHAIQFHISPETAAANAQSFIRNNGYFEAVVLSAVQTVDPRN